MPICWSCQSSLPREAFGDLSMVEYNTSKQRCIACAKHQRCCGNHPNQLVRVLREVTLVAVQQRHLNNVISSLTVLKKNRWRHESTMG